MKIKRVKYLEFIYIYIIIVKHRVFKLQKHFSRGIYLRQFNIYIYNKTENNQNVNLLQNDCEDIIFN